MSIHINRVYTRTGDDGRTALIGGERVPKDDARVEAYGMMDELNACLGLARGANSAAAGPFADELEIALRRVQNEVFDLGNELATPAESRWPNMPCATPEAVARLESEIDRMTAELPPLKSFVLPGGDPVSAALHLARTVCRRAERVVVGLAREIEVASEALRYVNRLSDWLFVLSRRAARGEETLWEGGFRRRG